MQCNIDQRGRHIRFIGGVLTIVAAALVLALGGRGAIGWTIATALVCIGLFQVFEAWMGWCAVRAMGARTPW